MAGCGIVWLEFLRRLGTGESYRKFGTREFSLSLGGWARVWFQEKIASIEIHRLGTPDYVRKNDLLNFQNFAGHFLIDHLQYPTRSACLEIHGFQIYEIQLQCPTDKNSWVPF